MSEKTTIETRTDRPRLEARGLGIDRGDTRLFSDLDLAVETGQAVQIEGANGCGKTTLLRVLCGLTEYDEGEVLWCGETIREAFADFAAEVCYIGHAAGVKEELTPIENLEMARALGPSRDLEPEEVLERVGLSYEQETVPCRKLSAGQRRRVALGRLLLRDARLWVLDEPFTALDRAGRSMVEGMLQEHVTAGGMAILTTHHAVELGTCSVDVVHLS